MSIRDLKKIILGIFGLLLPLVFVSMGLAEKWSQRYIDSLPDSAFAVVEVREDGKKVRHLPHHNHLGVIDIPHLKSALGRIHQIKWIDPGNFEKAKHHLNEHYRAYKQERARAQGLRGPVNINEASIGELMRLPHIGEAIAGSIVEHRKAHGRFKTTSDLRRVPGIGPKLFQDIEDLVATE
jgi:competence ComEA-like helix-hairpin-helix protein